MMLEVTRQACEASQVEMAGVPTVFATAQGELETLHALLEMLNSDGELSPARFHNSVYNTASGYFSIATGNRSFTTTLAGGTETVALGLLEACCLLEERQGAVVAAFGDEAVTLPFLRKEGSEGLAAALCLTSERPAGGCLGVISAPHRGPVADLPAVPPAYDSNPVAPALALLQGLRQRSPRAVPLSRGTHEGWIVDLVPDQARS
jgi:Beta-ketoacyl synthase, N-terminal domain